MKTPQMAANGRTYGGRGLWPRSSTGSIARASCSRSGRAIHSTDPNFVRGDWYGDACKQFFWYRFKLEGDGRGAQYFEAAGRFCGFTDTAA
jgi:hypothetical protein